MAVTKRDKTNYNRLDTVGRRSKGALELDEKPSRQPELPNSQKV